MSLKIPNNLDLNNNQALNMVIQFLAADPANVEGKIYYNSVSKKFRFYNGTTWADVSAGSGGDASTNTSSSVDGEMVLFSGTGGKTLKRSTLNGGLLKSTSGVPSIATVDVDYASTAYVDNAVAGLDWKDSVRVATTAAGTLASSFENGDSVDGVTLATNDRILIKNQAAPAENGIYFVNASGAPTRALDANTGAEVWGAAVYVREGTANAGSNWVNTNTSAPTLGSTSITFAQFQGQVQPAASTSASLRPKRKPKPRAIPCAQLLL